MDLGISPPSNSYLTTEALAAREIWYPLKVMVCNQCWLVQTEDIVGAEEMFSEDYAYFSSFSTTWVEHAKQYVSNMFERFSIDKDCCVVEIAANDGYLLQHVKAKGTVCYGIEPTAGTAAAAREKGIEIIEEFFGIAMAQELANEGRQADLTVANNVLAHVPDINDFVGGFALLLKPGGVATFEFPHLLRLVEKNQFDTIYHEHFSYLSLTAVKGIFSANGLEVFSIDELSTHGGSLRVYAQRMDTGKQPVDNSVADILEIEENADIRSMSFYRGLQNRALQIKIDFLSFLLDAHKQGKKVAAYGAAAKGNTMLNYAGVKPDLLPYVVDMNSAKQGKYLPGSRIPIVEESVLQKDKPDYIVILPWNLKNEVMSQLAYIREWGGQFVTAVPGIEVQ